MECYLKRIFYIILYATMMCVLAQTVGISIYTFYVIFLIEKHLKDCPEHTFTVNSETITWPASPISDSWIASDCLDEKRLLIFRQCLEDGWAPDNSEVETLCREKMNPDVLSCPEYFTNVPKQSPSSRTLCYRTSPEDARYCKDGNIQYMDLSIDEKSALIASLLENIATQRTFQIGGKNRWPNKPISSSINGEIGDIELQNTGCGRFGLPLTFSKNIVAVECVEDGDCDNMCLSLNITKEPFSADVTLEKCSNTALSIFTEPFLQDGGCSNSYYRRKHNPPDCYSIQMFPPIPVADVESANVKSICGDVSRGGIVQVGYYDSIMFTFRQLSEQARLTDGNNCLFGLLPIDEIVKYSDWDSYDVSFLSLLNFNWDKSMNYSRVTDELSYLSVKPNGLWAWAVDTVSCIVCMEGQIIEIPEIEMQYKFLDRKLEVDTSIYRNYLYTTTNSELGFICFALIGDSYKANLTIFPIFGSSEKYLIENVGMGQYWCSGHRILERTIISSPITYAYGIVFLFEVVRNCTSYCIYRPEDLDQFHEAFEQNFNFLLIKEFAFVETEPSEFEMEYTFTIQLSLTLQEYTITNLDTNLVNLTEYQIETVFIHEQLNKMLQQNRDSTKHMRQFGIPKLLDDEPSEYSIRSFISTEFCLHESTLSIDAILWRIAYLDETISPSLLCPVHENYSEITRTCRGDPIRGLYWEELVNPPNCSTFVSESLLELYIGISTYSNPATEVVENLTCILEANIQLLLPVDVFLTSQILEKVSNTTLNDLGNIFSIYNSLMKVDEHYLQISALFNSTNVLLEAFDNILLNHINASIIGGSNYTIYGNASIHSPLLKTFILNPTTSRVSGVALYRSRNSSISDDDFTDYSSRYVYPYETIDELLTNWVTEKDMVVGSYLPMDMLKFLTNVNVVINVFFNDKLFQPSDVLSEKRFLHTSGKIIAITILGLSDNSNLPTKIPIFFESKLSDNTSCAYWNFISKDGWSSNGCNLRKTFDNGFQRITVCDCTHLTHFGCLINNYQLFPLHERTLTIITIIGSSFSLFGTLGIFTTAAVFQKWRKKLSSKILIHFSVSIALEMILMIFINLDDSILSAIVSNPIICAVMGALLHYSVLAMYFWMLIIAYFQFKRYVVVFNFSLSHLLLKSTAFAWGVPLLPVITVLIINHSSYLPINKDELKLCYPTGMALYIGVIAPIASIFLVDCIVFVSVIVSLQRGLSKSVSEAETSKYSMRLSQIRLFAFLFFALGLTWVFGFLSIINPNSYLIFSYLFCITATMQGMVLFLYFIVLDPSIRSLWIKFLTSGCREQSSTY